MGSQSDTPEMFLQCTEQPSCWLGGQGWLPGEAGPVQRWLCAAQRGQQGPSSHPCPAGMHRLPPEKYKWHLTWGFRYSLGMGPVSPSQGCGMGTQPSWTIPLSRLFLSEFLFPAPVSSLCNLSPLYFALKGFLPFSCLQFLSDSEADL